MSIELDEGTVQRGNAPSLHFASAMPEKPKAMLAMIHGYADHGARYAHVMGALAEHGIGSVIIDLRGHGKSEGLRGYCERFSEYEDDVTELRRLVEQRSGPASSRGVTEDLPKFLFGHSFGGLVAAASAEGNPSPWKGLVLSGPFFGLALAVPRVKVLAGKVASKLYPKLGLPSGLAGKDVTHDPEKQRAYDNDPLVFKNATARWFTEATEAQERVLRAAPKLELPLWLTFGEADRIASFDAGKRFYDRAGSKEKVWVPKPGLFHEVLNEPSWKEIVEPMASWILAQGAQ